MPNQYWTWRERLKMGRWLAVLFAVQTWMQFGRKERQEMRLKRSLDTITCVASDKTNLVWAQDKLNGNSRKRIYTPGIWNWKENKMRTIRGEGKKAKQKNFKDHWKCLKAGKKKKKWQRFIREWKVMKFEIVTLQVKKAGKPKTSKVEEARISQCREKSTEDDIESGSSYQYRK